MSENKPHKHADLIHAWANGAEIQFKGAEGWFYARNPTWHDDTEYRIKPKEPQWWENIPTHGVLCWVSDKNPEIKFGLASITRVEAGNYQEYVDSNDISWSYASPLTNEEIKQFLRGE
jgi:hypothetical protein